MRMRLILALFFCATAANAAVQVPVVYYRLPNGLKVVVSEPADGSAGDLRTAQVQFYDRATGTLLGISNVAQDGTAIYNWAANLGTANSKTFTIGFIVAGYYTRNSTLDNVSITVSK